MNDLLTFLGSSLALQLFLLVVTLVPIVAIELKSGSIPNKITFSMLPIAIVARGIRDGWLAPLGGLAVSLAIGLYLFRNRFIAGGTTKLAFVLGAILGMPAALLAWVTGLLIGTAMHNAGKSLERSSPLAALSVGIALVVERAVVEVLRAL